MRRQRPDTRNSPQLLRKLSSTGSIDLGDALRQDIVALINVAMRGARWRGSQTQEAFRSVLNFANPPLALFGASTLEASTLCNALRTTLVSEESRLNPATIQVGVAVSDSGWSSSKPSSQWLAFDVRAQLCGSGDGFSMRLWLDTVHGHASLDA